MSDNPDKHEAFDLPPRQREALVEAVQREGHEPMKGQKAQQKALTKKGALDADGQPTKRGKKLVEHLAEPLDWRATGGLPAHAVGALSEDGETIYITKVGAKSEGAAYRANTIPDHIRRALGLN